MDKKSVTLKTCSRDGCNPVEQTRGEMRPEDHHAQFGRYGAVRDLAEQHGVLLDLDEFRRDAYEVEAEEEHRNDFRISCGTCGKCTGWDRCDVEEFRSHGAADNRRHVVERDGNKDNVRKRWNDTVR